MEDDDHIVLRHRRAGWFVRSPGRSGSQRSSPAANLPGEAVAGAPTDWSNAEAGAPPVLERSEAGARTRSHTYEAYGQAETESSFHEVALPARSSSVAGERPDREQPSEQSGRLELAVSDQSNDREDVDDGRPDNFRVLRGATHSHADVPGKCRPPCPAKLQCLVLVTRRRCP